MSVLLLLLIRGIAGQDVKIIARSDCSVDIQGFNIDLPPTDLLLVLSVAVSSNPWGERVSAFLLLAWDRQKKNSGLHHMKDPLMAFEPSDSLSVVRFHQSVCLSATLTRPAKLLLQHTPAGQSDEHVASNNTENHSDRRDTKIPVYTCRNKYEIDTIG